MKQVKAAPNGGLRFDLADEMEVAADRSLEPRTAAIVKACLTQFRITGRVEHLEACLEKFERLGGSVMSP